MPAKNRSNELKILREFNAPVVAVWDAWSDQQQVAQWWGPRGFSLTTHSKSLKPGGIWHYTMHGPDGTDYENKTLYLEVVKHEKLVYDHGGNDERAPLFRVTVLFSEKKGKTFMDMTMTLPTPEAAEETRQFIKKAGGDSTWDRLTEYLEKAFTGKEKFVINRSFDAPIEVMYDMWSDPKHMAQWTPPTGFTMKFIKADVKPGGGSFYVMEGSCIKMYGRASYIEMKRPDHIIYTQQFCDEHENLSRHPLAPTWPATMLTHVQFTAEGADRTRVTVTWEVHGEHTSEEMATFIAGRRGMTGGWTGSFNKLEDYIAAQQGVRAA